MKAAAIAGVLLAASAVAQTPPPSAAALLDQVKADAARGQRAIWVIFHASW